MKAKELPIPQTADVTGATEILRAFIVNGGLQVSIVRAFEAPEVWGILLADIARHAARIFENEGGIPAAQALDKICNLFDAEMSKPTDLGTTETQRGN